MSNTHKFVRAITRRTFLKSTLIILAPLFKAKSWMPGNGQAVPLESRQMMPYGAGTYGQSVYPGYQVNLPLILKKES